MPKVNYFEIPAKDPKKILKFYKDVFEWKTEPWGKKYWGVEAGTKKEEGIDGGIYLSEKMKTVTNTISVSDIDKYIERVKKNGGKVIDEPHLMYGEIWHIYFKDPEGTLSGISGPRGKMKK